MEFYQGQPNVDGVDIFDVWRYPLDTLERNHRYIQFLFPLQEESAFNEDAPLLTDDAIEEFRRSKVLKARLRKSFTVMMNFFGLVPNSRGYLQPSPTFNDRRKVWLTPNNHNHLRLTRIVKSLKLLGLEEFAMILQIALCNIYKTYPNMISAETKDFWFKEI